MKKSARIRNTKHTPTLKHTHTHTYTHTHTPKNTALIIHLLVTRNDTRKAYIKANNKRKQEVRLGTVSNDNL